MKAPGDRGLFFVSYSIGHAVLGELMEVITTIHITRLVSNKEKAFPIGKAFYILKI